MGNQNGLKNYYTLDRRAIKSKIGKWLYTGKLENTGD
jgi:hypothetical protein